MLQWLFLAWMPLHSESNTCSIHWRSFQLKLNWSKNVTKLLRLLDGECFMSMPSETADVPLTEGQASCLWVFSWVAESKGSVCLWKTLLNEPFSFILSCAKSSWLGIAWTLAMSVRQKGQSWNDLKWWPLRSILQKTPLSWSCRSWQLSQPEHF